MTEKAYQIIFSGQTVDGIDTAQAKVNLSKLYKTDVSRIEKLFQAKRAILKKNLSEDTALGYLTTLKKAGIICELEEMPAAADTPGNTKPVAATTPAPQAQGQSLNQAPQTSQAPGSSSIDAGAFEQVTIAPPGEVIMTHPKIEQPVIDTSGLDIGARGEDLVERITIDEPDIDISSLSMGEVGETLAEKVEVEPFEPDLADIDLAPVGSTIGPAETVAPPPPPDTSHISLKEKD